jgi:hypothetical protein
MPSAKRDEILEVVSNIRKMFRDTKLEAALVNAEMKYSASALQTWGGLVHDLKSEKGLQNSSEAKIVISALQFIEIVGDADSENRLQYVEVCNL